MADAQALRPTRKVAFLAVSDRLTASELEDAIGAEPDEAGSGTERFPTQASWQLHAVGSGTDDLSGLIEDVIGRLRPSLDAVTNLRVADPSLTCLLRIIQIVGDDPLGPGFVLTTDTVSLLARLTAFVDVDQYFGGERR